MKTVNREEILTALGNLGVFIDTQTIRNYTKHRLIDKPVQYGGGRGHTQEYRKKVVFQAFAAYQIMSYYRIPVERLTEARQGKEYTSDTPQGCIYLLWLSYINSAKDLLKSLDKKRITQTKKESR